MSVDASVDAFSPSMDDLPPDTTPAFDTPPDNTSAHLYTCEVCGDPLDYSGRGRPPTKCDKHKSSSSKSTSTRSVKSSADVNAAVAVLHSGYEALTVPMMLFAPKSAVVLSSKIDQLDSQNRIVFEANPKLAKQVATAGGKLGPGALIISNAMILGPIMLGAYAEFNRRRFGVSESQADDE